MLLWFFYEPLFWLVFLLLSPYYVMRMARRGGYARGFLERFGTFCPEQRARLGGGRPIWIHAVSVGEVELALRLIERIRARSGATALVLSTTTSTGHAVAARKLDREVGLFYYPLDSFFCFRRVHRLLQPRALILVEAELWPNHLRFCAGRGVPLALLNARLSRRRLPRYRRFRWVFAPGLRGFRVVTLQSGEDVAALAAIGFPKDALRVVGSVKYDTAGGGDAEARERLMSALGFLGDRPLWVAGSTHPGEEMLVADLFLRLRKRHPALALALAPRHAERAGEVCALLKDRGIAQVRRSGLPGADAAGADALVLDTTGELKYLYERATVIFMGKSLLGRGGQNIIEPAVCAKPVVFGPHMENFSSIVADFLASGAAVQVQDAAGLESTTDRLLGDPNERHRLGSAAAEVVTRKRGAMDRTLAALDERGLL